MKSHIKCQRDSVIINSDPLATNNNRPIQSNGANMALTQKHLMISCKIIWSRITSLSQVLNLRLLLIRPTTIFRATAGRTARCRCISIEFYGIVRFLPHSPHFLLVFVCRLQWIICQKATRNNQSDRIADPDNDVIALNYTALIIIDRQRRLNNKQNA